MKQYRSVLWKKFRDEVIFLDGGRCVKCGRGPEEGVFLHVHHKQYILGRKPWEYEYHDCETLCSGCHAAEHGLIRPKVGWQNFGYEDLGDLIGVCDYCGTNIRHVFIVHHERWMTMEVGEICCDKLTETKIATTHMTEERRFTDKRKRFISSSRWKRYKSGVCIIKYKCNSIFIVPYDSLYLIRINDRNGNKRFNSEVEAKKDLFDLIQSGEIDKYLSKCRGQM